MAQWQLTVEQLRKMEKLLEQFAEETWNASDTPRPWRDDWQDFWDYLDQEVIVPGLGVVKREVSSHDHPGAGDTTTGLYDMILQVTFDPEVAREEWNNRYQTHVRARAKYRSHEGFVDWYGGFDEVHHVTRNIDVWERI